MCVCVRAYIYIKWIHFAVQQKLIQYYKSTIPPKNNLKNKHIQKDL